MKAKLHINYHDIEDKDLFRLIQRGDDKAFTHVYYKYAPMLHALACRYLKDGSAADNTIQHIFMRLWEARSLIEIDVNMKNYLYTMTKNNILNQIRDKNNAIQKNYELLRRQPQYDDSLPSAMENRELQELLQRAISGLPKQKQQIIKLKREGFSNQEIADKLQIPVNTVKTYYAQSVRILKTKLSGRFMCILFVASCVYKVLR